MNETKFKTQFGTVSAFWRKGDPTYVFVHGLGCMKEHFNDAFDHPGGTDYGLLSVDLLGFGDSDRLPDDLSYTFETQAKALAEVLSQVDSDQITLVLHSMSAGLMTELPSLIGSRLKAVHLIEGNLRAKDALWSGTLAALSEEENRDFLARVRKTARYVLAKQLNRSHPREVVQEWSQGFTKGDDRAMHETAIQLHGLSTSGAIAKAVGEFDGHAVYVRGVDKREWDGSDFMAKLGINVVEISDAGHYVMLDDPTAVYDSVFAPTLVLPQGGKKPI